MDFDPSFQDKFPYLSMILPENPSIKSEIPIMVPLQQTSTLVPPPPINNTFMYLDNFHHFHHHPLNASNQPVPGFVMGGPSSSTNPFSMIPTPSSGDPYANGSLRDLGNSYYPMAFAPNNNKMEAMHGYLNNGNIWDFPQKVPIEFGASSQPQVGPSLPPPIVYGSVTVKPRLQDELSCITGPGNNGHWGTNAVVVGEIKEPKKKRVQRKSTKIPHKILNIIKGQWSPDEDRVLIQLVRRFGLKKWSQIAKLLTGRVGKQCRERWHNHLRPNIRKDSWTEEEDKVLIEAHKQVGNKWAEIARRLPGRSENTIKNHWNATKRRQNAKRQKNKRTKSKGTLLQNYIMEVTAAEAGKELKKSMSKMNLRSEDRNDLGCNGVGLNLQPHVPTITRNGGYVPMMVNVDEMASGSTIMDDSTVLDYEDAMDMDSFVPETQMKKEMDLMEMICRKP